MAKNKGGRPPKVKVDDLLAALDPYLEEADPPIVAEFAHLMGITRQRLYSLADEQKKKGDERLFDAIKRLSEEKEIRLERGALSGHYSPSVAIFSLKQLGWSDKQPEATVQKNSGQLADLIDGLKEPVDYDLHAETASVDGAVADGQTETD